MFRKNVAGQYVYFALVNATTGAALTGATVTGKRGIDGAAQASVTGTITEDAGGQYHLALSQADTNGNNIGLLFTATNAIPVNITIVTTAGDPTDSVRFGLTALPNAAAEAAGGLYTRGSGAGQIAQQANGQIDANVSTIKTQAVTCAAGVTVLASVGTAATSTAQTGDGFARLGAPAGASVSADIATKMATFTLPTNFATLLIDGSGRVTLVPTQIVVKKNTALAKFPFLMVDSADHITPKTGLTITATRSLDGAAFGACANSAVELANGIYTLDLAAADLNATTVTLKFTSAGADARYVTILPQP